MQEKLLRYAATAAKLAAAVAAGVIVAILVIPVSPTPESCGAFKAWEAAQTRQEGHGGDQAGEEMPWPDALRKPLRFVLARTPVERPDGRVFVDV